MHTAKDFFQPCRAIADVSLHTRPNKLYIYHWNTHMSLFHVMYSMLTFTLHGLSNTTYVGYMACPVWNRSNSNFMHIKCRLLRVIGYAKNPCWPSIHVITEFPCVLAKQCDLNFYTADANCNVQWMVLLLENQWHHYWSCSRDVNY